MTRTLTDEGPVFPLAAPVVPASAIEWVAGPPGSAPPSAPIGPRATATEGPPLPQRAGLVRRAAPAIASAVDWLFGAGALILGLAFLAAVPGLQLLSLGYLIEVSGRVAATGRLAAGFVGVRQASRLGSIVLGTWLWLLPLRYLSSLRTSAILIHPDELTHRNWNLGLALATVLVVLHVVRSVARGGRLRHFLSPWGNPWRMWRELRRPGRYAAARDAVLGFVDQLRLPHYFLLGLKGFLGGLVWLAPPITLIALGRLAPLVGFVGGLALVWVVTYLPFLQARLGAEGRWGAMFALRSVREQFRRAPVAYFVALLVTLAFALPLYLLKIEVLPREATWLPSLVFVVFIFPARLLVGWATARGTRLIGRQWFFLRWPAAWLVWLSAVAYVVVVYFSQFTSWYGIWSLYEQHAFLVPVPFLGS